MDSTKKCRKVLLAEKISSTSPGDVHIEDVASIEDTECSLSLSGKTCRFSNPLLALPVYRNSLALAAAAAMMLELEPESLSSFNAVPGRMSISREEGVLVVDNANSGTNMAATIEAAQFARKISGNDAITLVIGQVTGDGAVCEGFSFEQIYASINRVRPVSIVWVGTVPRPGTAEFKKLEPLISAYEVTLEDARTSALRMTTQGSIVLAVKTWR
jgi:UDP-N-acetylmuramyl pentapeptide synthase